MDDRPPPIGSAPGNSAQPPLSISQPAVQRSRPLPLRQMGIGELIDAAIQLYRREWKVLIAIVALVLVPVTFLEAYLTRIIASPAASGLITQDQATGALVASLVVATIQLLFIQPFLTASIARAASNVYLGEPVEVGPTYRFALARVLAILWISILTFLALMVGFILLVIPAFLVFVRTAFASTVLVVEGKRGTKAFGRSWSLASGHFWRLFVTLILAGLISGIVSVILTIPTEAVATGLGTDGWPIRALGQSLGTVLVTPFSTLIIVLLYFDLRIRKEGFDIEVMAQELPAQT